MRIKHLAILSLLLLLVVCQEEQEEDDSISSESDRRKYAQIVLGILKASYMNNEMVRVGPCLQEIDDYTLFQKKIDEAYAHLQDDSIISKVSATTALAEVLDEIIYFMSNCEAFPDDLGVLIDMSTELKSPLTLYAKALVNPGLQKIESDSYMRTAIAAYNAGMYLDFGAMLGYTMYAFTGGENKIPPPRAANIDACLQEQETFYAVLLGKYVDDPERLRSSLRFLSYTCYKKFSQICDEKNQIQNGKDLFRFFTGYQKFHQFIFDSILKDTGFSQEDASLISSRLECFKNLKPAHMTQGKVSLLKGLQSSCKEKDYAKIGEYFGKLALVICEVPLPQKIQGTPPKRDEDDDDEANEEL